jgi:hypothetical protein
VQSLALGAYYPPLKGNLPKKHLKGQQKQTN